jgi:Ser/Thr protein kinase RdoA (MazF antagonist)
MGEPRVAARLSAGRPFGRHQRRSTMRALGLLLAGLARNAADRPANPVPGVPPQPLDEATLAAWLAWAHRTDPIRPDPRSGPALIRRAGNRGTRIVA